MENEKRGIIILIRDTGRSIINSLITNQSNLNNKYQTSSDELRIYGMGAQILSEIGVKKMILLTNTEWKFIGLEAFDIEIIEVNTPSESLIYDDVSPILEYALQNRNEIKIAESDIELAQLNTKISKSFYLPNISMGYGFNASANFSNLSQDDSFFNQINDNKGHSVNMNIAIPIFNRNQTRSSVNKSIFQEEITDLALAQVKLNLESTIIRAFTDAKAALKAYQSAIISMEAQELAFNNAMERYNLGALNSFDFEQSRLSLLNSKSALINSKYDFIFKTKVLDFYLDKN